MWASKTDCTSTVAGGLILFESWRSRRKEQGRRQGVAEDITELQSKVTDLEAALRRIEQDEQQLATELKLEQETLDNEKGAIVILQGKKKATDDPLVVQVKEAPHRIRH